MAQSRMTHQALLDHLDGADTDVVRRVLEHAMQRSSRLRPRPTSAPGPTSGPRPAPRTGMAIESGFWTPARGASSCRSPSCARAASPVPARAAPAVVAVVKVDLPAADARDRRGRREACAHCVGAPLPRPGCQAERAESDVLAYLDFLLTIGDRSLRRTPSSGSMLSSTGGQGGGHPSQHRIVGALVHRRAPRPARRVALRTASLQPVVHGAAAVPRGPTVAHQPAHRTHRCLSQDVVRTPPNSHHSRGLDPGPRAELAEVYPGRVVLSEAASAADAAGPRTHQLPPFPRGSPVWISRLRSRPFVQRRPSVAR
jgi:hypothetical protein